MYTSSDEEEWLPAGQPAVEAEKEDMEEEEMYTTPHANLCVSPTNPPFGSSMTGQLNIEPAVSRQLGYRAAALKMEPPQKFKGDGDVSLEDWRLKISNYCKITGVDQHPDTHTAVVCSLLGEDLQTAWLTYQQLQQEPQTVGNLFSWLASCTVEVNRKEDIYADLDKLSWSLKNIPFSATQVATILARGAGDVAYAVQCPYIVRVVQLGMDKAGLSDLFRDVQYMPAVGGEAPRAWTDTTMFLNTLVATARKWNNQQQQHARTDNHQQGQGQEKRRRVDQQRPERPKQPRREPLPQPSSSLGPRPGVGRANDADMTWCVAYEKELRDAGYNTSVCYYCKKAGHRSTSCHAKQGKK